MNTQVPMKIPPKTSTKIINWFEKLDFNSHDSTAQIHRFIAELNVKYSYLFCTFIDFKNQKLSLNIKTNCKYIEFDDLEYYFADLAGNTDVDTSADIFTFNNISEVYGTLDMLNTLAKKRHNEEKILHIIFFMVGGIFLSPLLIGHIFFGIAAIGLFFWYVFEYDKINEK